MSYLKRFAKHPSARVRQAYFFALGAHAGQVRKYTGEPYINHPVRVAVIVENAGGTEDQVIAALLHDVVEDCSVSLSTLREFFGQPVSAMVGSLTNVAFSDRGPYHGKSRKVRHEANVVHFRLYCAPGDGAMVRFADQLDNAGDITQKDRKFAKLYLTEKLDYVRACSHDAGGLRDQVESLCQHALAHL